ncbi:hypothetical protein N7463_002616 [Penicillium fimorum]|uniref:Xylanolytic transcriptional activator regulatory domain-containing protein n=1 Tax=Penicillium fimorum TaxID=1882269 RepID=A0A9X0C955_9EURO|nr:hypothetical protein N7463_002616 [Penicillium fimorum]
MPTDNNDGDCVVYLGNCAALSFLQNIQQLIESETGYASIAADVAGLSVIEELPPVPPDNLTAYNSGDTEELERLIRVYFISTCGIVDLFERSHIESLLHRWINGLIPMKSGSAAVLVETVQAFVLISIFMLGCSRRNGASLNLGIAIGAAKSLGYHQPNTNSAYDGNERRQRAQIWKTLRYHDLFFSAMMGRSSSTSDTGFNIDEAQSSTPIEDEYDQSLSMTESARAFLVMEHIINDVKSVPSCRSHYANLPDLPFMGGFVNQSNKAIFETLTSLVLTTLP